ncbi:general odorant-binding protein 69a-like [Hylaeus anthracinus]|uniref:general odorant-binding protein 69a-like n=1 Tax=Hylaeus anthracinus TaxID=313031 RepID=UPI0023BA12BA|nr:general odorant-binding protein 69a-like [Hylaeus anthracinus]
MCKPSKVSGEGMTTSESVLIFLCVITSAFVFAIGAGSANPEDFRKMTSGVRKKCIAETKTTLKAIEDFEYGVMPDDDNLKCYFKCSLEKFGMMDKTGKIKYNMLKKVIPEAYKEVAFDMIDTCVDPLGKDNCDKVFNFVKCLYNENPMAFIAP